MSSLILLLILSYTQDALAAGTTVRKVDHGPTGYEVDFIFHPPTNSSPYHSVLLGGFPKYSDASHASMSKTNGYEPSDWKPDDFGLVVVPDNTAATYTGFNMTLDPSTG